MLTFYSTIYQFFYTIILKLWWISHADQRYFFSLYEIKYLHESISQTQVVCTIVHVYAGESFLFVVVHNYVDIWFIAL